MDEYHKIKTIYKRDPETKYKTLTTEFACPEFEFLRNNKWVFTEKVDGTNIRIMFHDTGMSAKKCILFGGKTDRAQIPASLVNKLNERFLPQIDLFIETFDDANVCFYGEGYGAKIQKGGNYRPDQDFVLFDIKIGNWWLQRKDVEGIGEKFGVGVVPIIGIGTLPEMASRTRNGFESEWGSFIAEGIVARLSTELRARSGERIITKIKHKDF